MWDRPHFLELPERSTKPRTAGITHVLDTGASLAEVDGLLPVAADVIDIAAAVWAEEMLADLAAGATWVVVEARESGTVGTDELPFETQQTWFGRRFGADVSLGNIAIDDDVALESLRLGLRADTAVRP